MTELHLNQLLIRCEEKVSKIQVETSDEIIDNERQVSNTLKFQQDPIAQMKMISVGKQWSLTGKLLFHICFNKFIVCGEIG